MRKTIHIPKAGKDKRIVIKDHVVEHEGKRWTIRAKADPRTKTLKVYDVYGDVSDLKLLREALQSFADSLALELYLTI